MNTSLRKAFQFVGLPFAVTLFVLLGISTAFAAGEYEIQPGDVVEFDVAPIPNLSKRMRVGPDGQINVPLLGWVDAAGRTLKAIEQDIESKLSKVAYRQRVQGDELPLVIHPDEVSLEIASFRPVYVTGEVVNSGAQDYLPDMTVRQLIALAGGFKATASTIPDNQLGTIAGLRADYNALVASYAASAVDVARLSAIVAGSETAAASSIADLGLPAGLEKSVIERAQAQLSVGDKLENGQRAYLQDSLQQNGQRVAVLREKQRQEQDGADADTANLDHVQALAGRGAVQSTRVTEARQQLLVSSSRALATKAELAAAEIRQANLGRELQKLGDERLSAALADLEKAKSVAQRQQAQMKGIKARLALLSPVAATVAEETMSFVIYRADGTRVTGATEDMDKVLQPGDVVQINQSPADAQGAGDGAAASGGGS